MSRSRSGMIPPLLQRLLVDLQWISDFQAGKVVNLTSRNFEQPNVLVGIKRRLKSLLLLGKESRKETVNYVDRIIDEAIAFEHEYEQLSEDLSRMLMDALRHSVRGIDTLLVTYEDDPATCAEVSVIVQKINFALKKYEEKCT